MPWIIVDTFFTVFLPSLLIVSHGYQPTMEYPTYPDLSHADMFSRLFNIICFLRLWYFNCVFISADGFAYVRLFAGIASGMLNTQYLDSYCNLFILIHALYHFGATDDDISNLLIFVMGDDNVILSNWTPVRLHAFFLFLETHALTRFGMVISTKKSIFTTLRSKIEMLGYVCNNGRPRRSLDKLVAQLCFPEHGMTYKHMSSRAIGIAYAAAGQDSTFHSFCKDVYDLYLPYAQLPINATDIARNMATAPFDYLTESELRKSIPYTRFPTQTEVSDLYSRWQGELNRDSKWNPAHFYTPPGVVPPSSVTLEEYMTEHGHVFPDVERLF